MSQEVLLEKMSGIKFPRYTSGRREYRVTPKPIIRIPFQAGCSLGSINTILISSYISVSSLFRLTMEL